MKPQSVVFVDGARTPFGRAGEKGMYWRTRADDMVVAAIIGCFRFVNFADRAILLVSGGSGIDLITLSSSLK